MSIFNNKVNQQLQEERTQISHGSCQHQQQQEKHSTKHVMLSETYWSTSKSLVLFTEKLVGQIHRQPWQFDIKSSRYIQSQLQKIKRSDLYFRDYNFTVKESLSSHCITNTNTIGRKSWSVHFTPKIKLLVNRYRRVRIHVIDFMA